MSEKTINEIKSIKTLNDIKKFIEYKKNNKLDISLEEFDKLQKSFKDHNKKNKIPGQDLYFNLDTLADIAELLSCDLGELEKIDPLLDLRHDNLIRGYDGDLDYYDEDKISGLIKTLAIKNLNSARNFIRLAYAHFDENKMPKLSEIINDIDFSKENDLVKNLISLEHDDMVDNLDGKIISSMFDKYSGPVSKDIFEWVIKLAQPGSIKKSVINSRVKFILESRLSIVIIMAVIIAFLRFLESVRRVRLIKI